jgi:hypothetical protein
MPQPGKRGSALITALIILMVIFTVGSGMLGLSMQMMRRGQRDALRTRALALADAGVEKAIFYLRSTAPDGTRLATWRTNGFTETVAGQGDYTLVVQDGVGDNAGHIVVTAVGRASDAASVAAGNGGGPTALSSAVAGGSSFLPMEHKRAVRVVLAVAVDDVSVWNNALFGGVGQAGKSIQGNVQMHGSVHLLGDGETYTDSDGDGQWDSAETYTDGNHNGHHDLGEAYTDTDADGRYDAGDAFDDTNGNGTRDPALTGTDLASDVGGDATISNNYEGMSPTLRGMLPDPTIVSYKGESVQSLSARLRVKHGRVNVSGSASVGAAQATGGSPAVKETIAGTWVSDGFGGSQSAGKVFSDNGVAKRYNLGDTVQFPVLTSPTVKDGVNYPTYMDYLKANALVIDGDLNLKPGDTYSASNGGNSLLVDASGNLTISGIIYVQGNITFDKSGGSRHMTYMGRGTLVATGNVDISTDLVPRSGGFPVVNAIGIIARHQCNLATLSGSSQLMLAGAFYAQDACNSQMQNEIAGSFVCSYFSMSNVPHLFQVPKLAQNLPPGMPGSGQIVVIATEVYSWREVRVPTI